MSGGNAQECFEDARKNLSDHLDSAATLMFGNDQISIRQIADIVIYGGLAHSNEQKSKIFEQWKNSDIMGFIWAEFFAYARHAVEILQYLRGLNQGVLDHIAKYGFVFRRRRSGKQLIRKLEAPHAPAPTMQSRR